MNYYLTSSHAIVLIVALAALGLSALPFVRNAQNDFSDAYVVRQLQRAQAEMVHYKITNGSFDQGCYDGPVSEILQDIIPEYGKRVTCITNKPLFTKMMICAELRSESHMCVDDGFVSCELSSQPKYTTSCKENLVRR